MNRIAPFGLLLAALALPLSGCDKARSLIGDAGGLNCNSEDSKTLVRDLLQQQLNEQGMAQLRNLIQQGETNPGASALRAAANQIQIQIDDVRTSRNDPQSSKKFCAAQLTLTLPPNLLNDANQSRQYSQSNSVQDSAVLNNLNLDGTRMRHELEYAIQPTDDGKKIYAEVSNSAALTQFVSEILVDALRKPALQASALAEQQQAQQEASAAAAEAAAAAAAAAQQSAQQQADQAAYQGLQQAEVQQQLNTANKQMNLVWQATSRWVRSQLLADQRVWLKKRELECRLNSAEAAPDQQELQRLRCEAQATQQRIPTLRSQIESLEAQQPAEAAEPAAPTTRSARTSPSEAADAAAAVAARQRAEQEATERAARQAQQQMQRNLQSLQKQLENQ